MVLYSVPHIVHGVPAGLKDVIVNVHRGEDAGDTGLLGGTAGAHERVVADEMLGVLGVEVRHAHLQGDGGLDDGASDGNRVDAGDVLRGAVRRLGGLCVRRLVGGIVIRHVHVPLHAAQLAAEDEGVAAVGAEGAKVLLEELRLLVKVAAHGLLVGEEEGAAGVLDAARDHPDRRSLLEEEGHAVQQLGGAARLQNHLVGVDKEGRLREDVHVKRRAVALGDDEALSRRHRVVQNLAGKRAHA